MLISTSCQPPHFQFFYPCQIFNAPRHPLNSSLESAVWSQHSLFSHWPDPAPMIDLCRTFAVSLLLFIVFVDPQPEGGFAQYLWRKEYISTSVPPFLLPRCLHRQSLRASQPYINKARSIWIDAAHPARWILMNALRPRRAISVDLAGKIQPALHWSPLFSRRSEGTHHACPYHADSRTSPGNDTIIIAELPSP